MADAPDMPRYEQLVDAHRALDQRLQDLVRFPHLNREQQLEETSLKKRKLALKDQMAALRAR